MGEQLSKTYEPKVIEQQANEIWSSHPYFHADSDGADRKAYTIVIPPPNVTAPLHLGHALNNTLQDILIRFRRMQNYNTLWMPGTDHAGIATQTVVEKRILSEEGKRRTDFEREDFVARVQAWKDEYEARIISQLKAMGCSCDWARTRFTMDEVCAKAVRSAFFKLFKDGLIYRGKRLVNWDPATQTVLADDEVEHETVQGHFWYLRYPLTEPVVLPSSTGTSHGSAPRGEGVPPLRLDSGEGVPPLRPESVSLSEPTDEILQRQGHNLPHWTKHGATYAVTFRLADSLPPHVLHTWRQEREDIVQRVQEQGRPLTAHEERELYRLHTTRIEAFLDSGQGDCHLAKPEIASLVQEALQHFDDQRYDLIAWCIMPNHIHVIVRPFEGYDLAGILHSWKSFTTKQVNRLLGVTGAFWQEEYYDHLIRDEDDFNRHLSYLLQNPETSTLKAWPWVGSKLQSQQQPFHGQDARETQGRDALATSNTCITITHVTVATTRPETMLGDTAIAMNPNDPRAKYLVGKKIKLPIVGRIIPIIADEHVVLTDPNSEDEKARFSTGFLKVTPAHDPDDWEIGQRHGLPVINIMAPDGSISDKYDWTDWNDIKNPDVENLIGMDRFEAREAIVEWFRQEDLLEDVREYTHEVGHSYRSHVPIEPYLSDQWYIAVRKPIEHLKEKFGQGIIEGTDVPVNSLAGLALKPLLDGRLRFIPDRYAKTYQTWLENLRDWPISRQLWWGHQIPVWRCTEKTGLGHPSKTTNPDQYKIELQERLDNFSRQMGIGRYHVLIDPKRDDEFFICSSCNEADEAFNKVISCLQIKGSPGVGDGQTTTSHTVPDFPSTEAHRIAHEILKMIKKIKRDEDVLDTWFSSALWPFSTLGWPDESPDLRTFYPGDVLCTAREIITLWVSRMVMMGQYCMGDIPFRDVYIHAMIQDGEGRKMSKSLGNGIDPLVAIDSHGADAMRFTLASMTTDTQDIRMPVASMTLPDGRQANTSPKFDIGRNFCNKLWNASRFAMMNLEGTDPARFDPDGMDITDKWILSRLAKTISEVTESLEQFKYSEPLASLYRFFWNDFCDWYLEWTKPRMQDERKKPIAQNVLAFVLDQTLRLLHPFVPFITEGIFQKLNELAPSRGLQGRTKAPNSAALVIAEWPSKIDALQDPEAESQIEAIQAVIRAIRDIRNNRNIPPKELLVVSAKCQAETADILNRNADLIRQLAVAKDFRAGTDTAKPANAAVAIADAAEVYVHEAIDPEAERQQLEKQKQQVEKAKEAVAAKLGNENFVTRAKPDVVAQAREKLVQLTEQLEAIERHLSELKNSG
jgi:valyl-tRNA synthetase